MTIPRTLRKYIEAGRLDEVESAWLTQLETDAGAVDFFVAVARALKGAGEEASAQMLLEILYEEWQAEGALELRLALLREVGLLLFESEALHEEILSILRDLYQQYPSLEGFVEQVGLHRATDDVPKTWKKVGNLRAILQFEMGSIVWMKGKGAGRVTEVNFELENFKVDFERSPGLRVGFSGASKLMSALLEDHILRRKIEDRETLIEVKSRNPGELLLLTLRSYDEPRGATQVREALAGIVDEKEWSSWWAAARKEPQVLTVGKGARQLYTAAASSADAEEAVIASFLAADTKGKLEIFRRNADRNEELCRNLGGRLVALAERGGPNEVEVRFAVAQALKGRAELPDGADWLPERIVADASDAVSLVAGLDDRILRDRAYELVRETRSDWPDVFAACLDVEQDPRLLARLATALSEAHLKILLDFYDRVLSQPRKRPAAFIWLAERAQGDPALLERKPLRFLRALLTTSHPREMEPFKSRLRKVLEDGGPVAQLIQRVEADQAASVEELLKRSLLEEYLRGPLIDALHMRFPDRREEAESPLYATPDAIAERRAELKELREVEIPDNRRAIEVAREMGDLRENFEYKAARQRHEYLAARQATLQSDLARTRPLDLRRDDADEVRVATRVTIQQQSGGTRELLILGPWESDPDENVISYDSELARALLTKRVGDSGEFGGDTFEVTAIAAWHGGTSD